MQCPACSKEINENWQPLYSLTDKEGKSIEKPTTELKSLLKLENASIWHEVTIMWMVCPNSKCSSIIVHVDEDHMAMGRRGWGMGVHPTKHWFAVPQHSVPRPIAKDVPVEFAKYYRQAADILDLSPSASAALSRRILADLLEAYAGQSKYNLEERIDEFNKDTKHPIGLRENLHRLREAGNLSVHTNKDDQLVIIDVDREEAEWTLDVIDRLFDYFIVTPASDAKFRKAIDEKVNKAGRKPIKPLPDDGDNQP